jgi:hypothetical protein
MRIRSGMPAPAVRAAKQRKTQVNQPPGEEPGGFVLR